MAHTLSVQFLKLLQNIQPPEERRKKAVELVPPVREFLAAYEAFPTKHPHTRLAGSYAQYLTVGDVKDVDFLIRTDGDPESGEPTAREVLKGLHAALQDLPEALGFTGDAYFDIERNRRSVHVYFQQEDFHLDVVPCIAPEGFDKPLYVPDWGYQTWVKSHPVGVVKLVAELNDEHHDKFRSLAKLLKHFRNAHMKYMQPKSYWLVSMVIAAVDGGYVDTSQPMAVAFDQLLNHLYTKYYSTYLRDDEATPNIKDPILGHSVSWNRKRNDFEAFMRRLEDGKGWTGRALATDDKGTAIELWQKVFGDAFEADVEEYAKTLAAERQPGRAVVATTGIILPGATVIPKSTPVTPTRYYGEG